MPNPIFAHFEDRASYLDLAHKVSKKYFEFDSFRPHQKQCISSLWDHSSCVILTPTGGGKSLCYTVPALLSSNLTLIISPLISLMEDQVQKLKTRSIPAERLHSGLNFRQKREVLSKLKNASIKMLYISVERFSSSSFRRFIKHYNKIDIIAIDEAHCINEWKFFRPCYKSLGYYLKDFSNSTLIFLTATATKATLKDINRISADSSENIITASYKRDNLVVKTFSCSSYEDKISSLLHHLKQQSGSGIIYAITRHEVEHLAQILSRLNIPCFKYHSKLPQAQKELSYNHFLHDPSSIIVATKAFGMGIDKPDIRFVFHSSCPSCMEDYFQEIGRAGRDNLSSNTFMFYHQSDIDTHLFMFDTSFPDSWYISKVYNLSCKHLSKDALSKQKLLSKIKSELQVRNMVGISNCIDILLRFHLLSNPAPQETDSLLQTSHLSVSNDPICSLSEVGKIILKEKKENIQKLKTFVKYINTKSPSLKEQIYFDYFATISNLNQ